MSAVGAKRFFDEMAMLLQKNVTVVTTGGKKYVGTLSGFDPNTLSLALQDVHDEEGKILPKLFINGAVITQLIATEKPLDLGKLAERLERVFPKLVKYHEPLGVIVVMDKIRVGPEGLIEGVGPAAERAIKVYEEFIKEVRAQK